MNDIEPEVAQEPEMLEARSRLFLSVVVGAVLFAAFAVLWDERPAVPTGPVPDSAFDARRAAGLLGEIAREPRPVGSRAHGRAGDRILREIQRLGSEAVEQRGRSAYGRFRAFSSAARVRNIMTRVRGQSRSGAVLVLAHYDSVATSPGASDDGYGTVVLLETLRLLGNRPAPERDVIFLWTDAEERGLLGARLFVETHAWSRDVAFVVNVEARGNRGPALLFEMGPNSGGALAQVVSRHRGLAPWSLAAAVYRQMPNDSDFTLFRERNLPGFNFANIAGVTAYHSMLDTPQAADLRTIQHHGESLLATLDAVAYAPLLPVTKAVGESPPTAFVLPGWGGVVLSNSVVLACGVLAVFVTLLALASAFREGRLRVRDLTRPSLRLLLVLLAAIAAVFVLRLGLPFVHREYDHYVMGEGYGASVRLYRFGFSLLPAAIVALLMSRIAIEKRLVALAIPTLASLLPLLGAMLLLPDGAYLFAFPALLSSLALLCALGESDARAGLALALALCAVVASVLLWAPAVHLFFESFGLGLVVVPTAAIAWVCVQLAPFGTGVGLPRGSGVVSFACVGILLLAARFSGNTSSTQPLPVSLLHAQEEGGRSHWISCLPVRNEWSTRWMGKAPPEDPLTSARYFPALSRCPYGRFRFRVARAPTIPQAGLRVNLERGRGALAVRLAGMSSEDTVYVFARAVASGNAPVPPVRFVALDGVELPAPQKTKLGYAAVRRLLGFGSWITGALAAPAPEATVSIDTNGAHALDLVIGLQRPGLPDFVAPRPPHLTQAPVQPFHDSRVLVRWWKVTGLPERPRLTPAPPAAVTSDRRP